MPVSTKSGYVNVKAPEGVSCWYCEHFQRYDFGDQTPEPGVIVKNCGECRFNAPLADHSAANDGAASYEANMYWRYISNARQMWCSKFQRSAEQNIPDPYDGYQWSMPGDWDTFHASPWNKKTMSGYVATPGNGIACWNCDHWQPYEQEENGDFERNGEQQVIWTPAGECRNHPGIPYRRGLYNALSWWEWNRFPYLTRAQCYWCNQWERARRDVGDPPPIGAGAADQSAWNCPQAGPGAEIEIIGATTAAGPEMSGSSKDGIKSAPRAAKKATKKTATKKATKKAKAPKPIPTPK